MEKRTQLETEISNRFRLPTPTLVSSPGASPPMTFSHIVCDILDHGKTRCPPMEDAYVVQLMMTDMADAQLWLNGREVPVQPVPTGGVYMFHLESQPVVSYHAPFDNVRMYLAKETLDELADSTHRRRPDGLKRPEFGAADPLLYRIALCVSDLLARGEAGNQLVLDHVALAFHAHLIGTYAGMPLDGRKNHGGLSPWQERRVKDYIDADLGTNPGLADLAAQCGLSTSHFASAFKNTTGRPPHKWLTEQRVAAAKRALIDQNLSLAQIAADCGFADPSHFSRVFSKATGEAPAAWRRIRIS